MPAAMAVSIRILAAKRVLGLTVMALTPVIIAGPLGRIRLRRDLAGVAVIATAGRREVLRPHRAGRRDAWTRSPRSPVCQTACQTPCARPCPPSVDARVVRQLICGTWSEYGYLLKTFACRAVRKVEPSRNRARCKRPPDQNRAIGTPATGARATA